jgi:hypothetical protein
MAISPLPEWACPHPRITIVSRLFGIDTAEAQALERAGMHTINICYSEAHGDCIQNKRVRRAGLESRIRIAYSVF